MLWEVEIDEELDVDCDTELEVLWEVLELCDTEVEVDVGFVAGLEVL